MWTLLAALVGAVGSVLSVYIAAKVRTVAVQTNGRIRYLEHELRLTRALIDDLTNHAPDRGSEGIGR